MSANEPNAKEGIDVEPRTRRAATESMSLDHTAGDAGEFDVYAESGSIYRVNVVVGECECPSAEYQPGKCKHVRRVEMETGQRDVPDLDDRTDVETMIEAREKRQQPASVDQGEAVTDGGVAVESVETADQPDQRPDECDCHPAMDTDDIGCWPCYRAGFETANPDPSEEDD